MTEKIYDALAAGCLPIYLGAPNIQEFIPSVDGIIDYRVLGSPEKLAHELRRLSANESAYQEKFQWQKHPESWSKAFKNIQARSREGVHTQCQLCQVRPQGITSLTSDYFQNKASSQSKRLAQGKPGVSPNCCNAKSHAAIFNDFWKMPFALSWLTGAG